MEPMKKASQIVERIRTPLALAGLVVLVLYGIYKQILEMDIFARVGDNDTVILIGNVLYYLFILAIISILLGGVGYILASRDNKSKR